jgi:hypothetical protein
MLDTSTVILLGRLSDPSVLPADSVVSAITLAELSVGPHLARTARERVARQAHLQQSESDFEAIAFGPEAARAYDALIAATALAENIPIYTCNPDDFAGIEGLEVHAVPHPDS